MTRESTQSAADERRNRRLGASKSTSEPAQQPAAEPEQEAGSGEANTGRVEPGPEASSAPAETAKKATKPRVMREKIIAVEDPKNGTTSFYRAYTQSQARAKHVDDLEMREATLDEVIAIGAGKLACTNALATAEPDPAQQSLPGVPVENLGATPVYDDAAVDAAVDGLTGGGETS